MVPGKIVSGFRVNLSVKNHKSVRFFTNGSRILQGNQPNSFPLSPLLKCQNVPHQDLSLSSFKTVIPSDGQVLYHGKVDKQIRHMAKIKFMSLKDMDDPLMGRRKGGREEGWWEGKQLAFSERTRTHIAWLTWQNVHLLRTSFELEFEIKQGYYCCQK